MGGSLPPESLAPDNDAALAPEATTSLDAPHPRKDRRWWWAAAIAITFLVLWGVKIALTAAETRPEPDAALVSLVWQTKNDQKLDLDQRGKLGTTVLSWFPHRAEGRYEPLWPWIAAWFAPTPAAENGVATPEETDTLIRKTTTFFLWSTGIFIALVGLLSVGAKLLSPASALAWMLFAGFESLFPLAREFSPNALFACLYLLIWICMLGLFRHNAVWLYIWSGALAGFAFMTAPGTGPLLTAFLLVGTYRLLSSALPLFFRLPPRRSEARWSWTAHFIGMGFFASTFFLAAGPRLSESIQTNGTMTFHHAKHWRWLDSPAESIAWTTAWENSIETDREIMIEEAPEWSDYARTHTLQQAYTRLTTGFYRATRSFCLGHMTPDGIPVRYVMLLVFFILPVLTYLLLLARCRQPVIVRETLQTETGPALLVALLAVFFTLLRGGWDMASSPVGLQVDFLLAPVVFTLLWGTDSILRRVRRREGPPWIPALTHALLWLFCLSAAILHLL